MRFIILGFASITFNQIYSQAGIDRSPNDIFSSSQNLFYEVAKSSLRAVGNHSNTVLAPSAYINCLENIKRVYVIEGNYAGALGLLTGEDEAENDNPAMQFIMPKITENMQEVIARVGKQMNTDLIKSKFYESLSEIYDQLGNHHKGLAYQLQCQKILEKQNSKEDEYIKATILLGERYVLDNEPDSAYRIYNNLSENDILLNKDSSNFIRYHFLKALITQKQNKLYKAISLYKQIFHNNKKCPQYYEMALNLGLLYMQTQQFHLADSVLGQNFSVLRKLAYKSVIYDEVAEALCENLLYMNKTEQASKTLILLIEWMHYKTQIGSMGITEDEELIYVKRINKAFDVLYTILSNNSILENQKLMLDVLVAELQYRNRVLLNRKELRKHSQPQIFFYLDKSGNYHQMPGIKTIIAQQYSLPYYKRYLNIDSLEEISDKLERKRAAKSLSHDYKMKQKAIHIATQPQTANIEFVRFIYKKAESSKDSAVYAAFIFEQSFSTAVFVPLCSEEQMLKMMKDENGNLIDEDQLSDKLYSSARSYSTEFYKLVWAPLAPYLKHSNDINYSPAGILNNISVGAIYNGANYLSDVFRIHFFSSLTDASVYNIAYEKPVAINIWGNINYNSGKKSGSDNISYTAAIEKEKQKKDADTSLFPPLGSLDVADLKKISDSNQLKPEIYELDDATEDSFKNEAANAKGVLHISTHGFYIPFNEKKAKDLLPGNYIAASQNPLFRSGLAFSGVNYYWKKGIPPEGSQDDGVLTAYEIEELDLHKVQLVVLSACETALGESTYNEGNLGLQRAFKLAGVHYVLVSLWRVNAKITAELLSQFYRNWFSGQSLSESLSNAQKSIKQTHSSPYFWAGFVLIE